MKVTELSDTVFEVAKTKKWKELKDREICQNLEMT